MDDKGPGVLRRHQVLLLLSTLSPVKLPEISTQKAVSYTLVTLRGTNTLLGDFVALLDASRTARDGADFERLLATPGFLSAKAAEYCKAIITIIAEFEGRDISPQDVRSFLRVLHVLSLDLNTSTGQTEAVIKSLLAYTAGDQDPVSAAEASWNALLHEASEGMPAARSFRRDDLPESLRRRHSPVGGTEQRALQTLRDHSAFILDGIHATIGNDLHLSRDRLVQKVMEQLELTQIVLVSGPAGSGKSVIAKAVVGILGADHFVFSFRAEELASPSLDETLLRSQIPCSARMLGAILAGQGRKVLLVESIERLLEASTRDAFTDLLTLLARDPSWRLILTCRDYSTDLVRTAFLQARSIGHSVIMVPPLDDEELREVEATYPTLARPLGNPSLRRLLRNPYILDKALQINWSPQRPLPLSEREFRARFWQEIVRVDHRPAQGMPRRREVAFIEVALRRARALNLYAPCGDLDPEVVNALRGDSLIVASPNSSVLIAPAHDVLEDWAILQWIDEQYETLDGSIPALSSTLGTYPAVRRTYRKWVSELAERDPVTADQLFQTIVDDDGLPAHFRDDTLVSLLRSPASTAFLERHGARLFANDKWLLRRVIHLLRVACVATPPGFERFPAPALFNVPNGPAWASVLRLVHGNLGSFTDGDRPLLLGLIEDWARGVSWQVPYPEGAESAAAIAHWLLPGFNGYRSDDQRKRTLAVIAKIPNADRDRFIALLRGGDHAQQDRTAEEFRETILEGLDGMPAARDLPEAVAAVAKDYLLCSEDDLRQGWDHGWDLELETLFGIKHQRSHGYFPPSAYRGPFLYLLRYHPRQGLDLIIEVINHSADWYAHPRVQDRIEPPFEITLTFADGTPRKQWCNARLWNLYRGASVGPSALQSILMALELWLLEVAESRPDELDQILLDILRRSDSAALTAVVASVATAFPHASGESLLVLLSSRECIQLDRQRLVNESGTISRITSIMPRLNARNEIYEWERKQADSRPHRQQDLEAAVIQLQWGSLAPRVHQVLDGHRAAMRPVEEQDEEDRIWRLALHRMDLRQYSIADDPAERTVASEEHTTPSGGDEYVTLVLKQPESDVKEMVDRSAARFQAYNARSNRLMWGIAIFNQEDNSAHDPCQWRKHLQDAMADAETLVPTEKYEPGGGAAAFVAAVCVRDHWEEMSGEERRWCVEVICSEVEREADNWNHFARVQCFRMGGDRPSAWILPMLVGKQIEESARSRVRRALVLALTHAIDEVRWYAAAGVGIHLWAIDRELALRCVNALATEAIMVQEIYVKEADLPYPERRHTDDIEAEAASNVRQRLFEPEGISPDALRIFDPTHWFGAEANKLILTILGQAPTEDEAITGFQRLAITLARWWDADEDRRRDRHQERRERNYETEAALTESLENFLVRTMPAAATTIIQPIVNAMDRHPDKVSWFVIGLIGVEDRQPNTPQFWALWKLFADKVRSAQWLAGIDKEHAFGAEMISAIFLGTRWKKEVRHWRSLEGYAERVHALFEDLPASSLVLDAYVRFLYHVGEKSLPEAFIRIANRLQKADPRRMLRTEDTVFMLEVLLQRYVYGQHLKRQADLRTAVLFLLDLLVEQGSSPAFRMRDDFVTPASLP